MEWTMGPPDTWDRTKAFLESLAAQLPEKPAGILVISGHWEESVPTSSTAVRPALIYDYSGFPEATYHLQWPAPGSPEIAARAGTLLRQAGLPAAEDSSRGFDHGVFVPLKVAFPQAIFRWRRCLWRIHSTRHFTSPWGEHSSHCAMKEC
jgi:aromatic ring-opening dioxygenase catalytic subunit (LigB family)